MKRALGSQLALLIALGLSSWQPTPVQAIQFDQAEADQSRFVILASPIGTTASYKLLIFEQLNNRRLCWQESSSNPIAIEPLFLEFDFTGICGRSTDSNAYSVRVAGQDLAGRYHLRLARKQDELVLVAYSLVENSAKLIEIGRTRGLVQGFMKITLDPGWRLTRRSLNGKNIGHLYLTHDSPLAELINTATRLDSFTSPSRPSAPPTQVAPTPIAPGSAQPQFQSQPQPQPQFQPQPQPQPQFQPNPVRSSTPTPLPSPAVTPAPVQPGTSSFPPASGLESPSTPASTPTNPAPANPPQTTAPQNFVVPTVPGAAPKQLSPWDRPQSSVIVPVGSSQASQWNQLPSSNNVIATGYRVVVAGATPEQQAQVRQLVPGAFRTTINGQAVMQAGVFRDRATAIALQQQLALQNLNATILSTPVNIASQPAPISNPAPLAIAPGIFNLPEPATTASPVSLWATYYSTHRAEASFDGYPLLDPLGNNLGVILSHRDWCAAALEGSVQVMSGPQVMGTYNFAGRGETAQVDCSPFYPKLSTLSATNRVRFKLSNTLYGEGTGGNQLVPYRTIAVDKTLIPIGSVIYIPAARGTLVTLPSGQQAVHDGYFYAADTGAAIKGNHIDVYVGLADRNPFRFVQSTATGTFPAYIVNSPEIQASLAAQHRLSNTAAQVRR